MFSSRWFRRYSLLNRPTAMAPGLSTASITPIARASHHAARTLSNGACYGSSLNNGSEVRDGIVNTDFLIIGAGPAGAALACFLGSYGRWPDKTIVQ